MALRCASCPRCAWQSRALPTRMGCGACRTSSPRSALLRYVHAMLHIPLLHVAADSVSKGDPLCRAQILTGVIGSGGFSQQHSMLVTLQDFVHLQKQHFGSMLSQVDLQCASSQPDMRSQAHLFLKCCLFVCRLSCEWMMRLLSHSRTASGRF